MRALFAPAWLLRHAVVAVLVAGFLWLGWWQLGRAASGNVLSWAYAVQWPVFAGFVVFIWWREAQRALRPDDRTSPVPPTGGEVGPVAPAGAETGPVTVRRPVRTTRQVRPADADDPALAAYNRYLAWLNANPGARPGDYPG